MPLQVKAVPRDSDLSSQSERSGSCGHKPPLKSSLPVAGEAFVAAVAEEYGPREAAAVRNMCRDSRVSPVTALTLLHPENTERRMGTDSLSGAILPPRPKSGSCNR